MSSTITIQWPDGSVATTTPDAMAEAAGAAFPVSDRVFGAPGEGFDLLGWYRASAPAGQPEPTHVVARAADGFEAVVPRSQLGQALLQYALNGQPLAKGGPARLYVPNGSSACLNVKSIVQLRFLADDARGEDATYGFVTVTDSIGALKRRT